MRTRGCLLFVDDNSELRTVVHDALTEAGYEVRVAEDGSVALQVLSTFIPDLLIVDIDMPVMSGRELLHVLRARGRPPFGVIAISGTVGERDSPARWFLRKPFDIEMLLRVVAELMATGARSEPRRRAA